MSDDSMIEEFKIEAQEMFESSEEGFLKIEKGEDFVSNYNLIFRSFHSLKGAAGMFGLDDLQSHMHKLESLFEAQKSIGKLDKAQIDYFLAGIDCAKSLLDNKKMVFKYYTNDEFKVISSEDNKKILPHPVVEKISTDVREKHKEENKSNKKGLFFIVDDEESILTILEDLVTEMGFDVRTFNSGKNLLSEINDDTPDVILSDIKMPEMSGIELLHKLREDNIETPVIFISGYISKEIMLDALENGAYGFVEKPFNDVYLRSICENAYQRVLGAKLLHKSINYILYQFSDLDAYLKSQNKENLRQSLKTELTIILDQQKKLRELRKIKIKKP
jgi:FixJ family two-component response regulator/HPt (histidine-containing phosphotransfer) domain-containing protein